MSIPHEEGAVRGKLAKAVTWRWPREKLLFITSCRVDRMPSRAEWFLGLLGRAHCVGNACVNDPMYTNREAMLGITKARMVYRTRGPHGLILKSVAVVLAGLAIMMLVLNHLAGFLWLGGASVVVWPLGRVAEWFGLGSGYVEFGKIRAVDKGAQRIEGVSHWGTLYRLQIPDPSDFRMIVSIAATGGTAA